MKKKISTLIGAIVLLLIAGAAGASYYMFTTIDIDTDIDTPIILPDEEEVGVIPSNGTWSFNMTGTASDLHGAKCPGAGAMGSSGTAYLHTSNEGATMVLNIDSTQQVFHGSLVDDLYQYETNKKFFPVATVHGGYSVGTVYFDAVANTFDTIVGTVHWDNQQGDTQCAGDYPFTMELINEDLPYTPIITLADKDWLIELDTATDNNCDENIVSFENLEHLTDIEVTQNFNSDGTPDNITLDTGETEYVLENHDNSNIYYNYGDDVDLGAPLDETGNIVDGYDTEEFTSHMEINVNYENEIEGTVFINSTGGCSTSINFYIY